MFDQLPIVESLVEVPATTPAVDEALLLTFRLGEGEFAVAIEEIQAVEVPGSMTAIPGTPSWLLGIANCRGEILSFVDLGVAASLGPAADSPRSRALVARSPELNCAVVVDQVTGLVRTSRDAIQPCEPSRSPIGAFARGVVLDAERAIVVLDLERLIQSPLLTLDS